MQNLPGDLVGPLNYTKTKTTKDQSGTQKPATLRLSRSLHTYLWKSSSDTESLKRKKGSLSSVSFTRRSWQKQRAQMAQLSLYTLRSTIAEDFSQPRQMQTIVYITGKKEERLYPASANILKIYLRTVVNTTMGD